MAAGKFHVNPDSGVVSLCRAENGGCPFGEENHFDHARDGRARVEELNRERNIPTISKKAPQAQQPTLTENNPDKDIAAFEEVAEELGKISELKSKLADKQLPPGERTRLNGELRSRQASLKNRLENGHSAGKSAEEKATPKKRAPKKANTNDGKPSLRELNNLAKDSESPAELLDAAERGSNRVLANLVKNEKATGESLAIAAERGDAPIKRTALKHPNYPVEKMTPEEFALNMTRDNAFRRLESPHVGDEHVEALKANPQVSANPLVTGQVSRLFSTPNRITDAGVESLVSGRPQRMAIASIHGRYDLAKNIDKLDLQGMKSVATSQLLPRMNGKDIDAIVDKASEIRANHPEGKWETQTIINRAVENKNLSAKSIDKIVKSVSREELKMMGDTYNHPNASAETKKYMEEANEGFASQAKIAKIAEQGENLRETLFTASGATKRGRAYNVYEYKIDMDKVKQYGLSKSDIIAAMGAGRFNADLRVDMERGVFIGGIDSGD